MPTSSTDPSAPRPKAPKDRRAVASGCCVSLSLVACALLVAGLAGLVAFRTQLSLTQQEAYLETFSAHVDDIAQSFRASVAGVAMCGDGCRRHEDDNQRLQYEILHLQHEKRALEKELVAVKSTVAALTEKLGKAGERLKKQQVAF